MSENDKSGVSGLATVAYIRVSTSKQAEQGLSLEAQERAIREYCSLYGLPLGDILRDNGASAKSLKGRPGLALLMDMVKGRQVGHIVIYKLDRLFRSIRDALATFDLFDRYDVKLHSVMEKLDTGTATGEFFLHTLLALAQLERRQIGERTSAVLRATKQARGAENPLMAHRAQAGKLVAGNPPYGYKWEDKTLVENPEEMRGVRLIRRFNSGGLSVREIIRSLEIAGSRTRAGGEWHEAQIRRIIRSPSY